MLTLTPGERILLLRKRSGRTQAELAEIAGTSRVTVINIENDARALSRNLAERIAAALAVPVEILLEEA